MKSEVSGGAAIGVGIRPVMPVPAGLDSHSAEIDADDADMANSLKALSQLSTVKLDLEQLLVQVAHYAVQGIPGADGAGLTLSETGRSDTIVVTDEFVRQVDDIQYSLGQGPCITAAEYGVAVRSGSLGGDPRWPRFGPRVGRLGVHSVLSLPLHSPNGVIGAMNVYAHVHDAFDEHAEQMGEIFAAPAAITVHNAQVLAQTARLAAQLQAALNARPIVDQAIGVLRSRSGISADEAFQRLRQMSQSEHTKLVVIAQRILDEAVGRARARHSLHE